MTAGPSDATTCWKTASSKSTPPRCSTPSGLPRIVKPVWVFSSTHTSKVPPPRSYTTTREPGSSRARAAYWTALVLASDCPIDNDELMLTPATEVVSVVDAEVIDAEVVESVTITNDW